MLDLGFVRGNLEVVEQKLRARGADPAALLGNFRQLDQTRREAITASEQLKARRNELSQQVGALKQQLRGSSPSQSEQRAMTYIEPNDSLHTEIEALTTETRSIKERLDELDK